VVVVDLLNTLAAVVQVVIVQFFQVQQQQDFQ
jgi:hypothetical protein